MAEKKKVKKSSVIIAVISIIIIFIGVIASHYIITYTKDLQIDNGEDVTEVTEYDIFEGEDESNYDIINSMLSNTSLNGFLKSWYEQDGDPLTSKHVMNILLIGLDSFEGTGNSDVMMVVSINNETKKITLCSILRDSYSYFETAYGSQTFKINAAYAAGGPKYLVKAIENNYKIKIDYYAAVDFTNFQEVIDSVGGINLDVTSNEASGIYSYTGGKVTVPVGENVHLSGEQALYFARMRKIYNSGDIHRTENQRKVIQALIDKSKTLSLSQLDNVIRSVTPYIRTNCTVANIISLATVAVTNKWYDYEIVSQEFPGENARTSYSGSYWIWVVDYPQAAYDMQMAIYGESNIVLDENRTTAFDLISTVGY